MFTGKYSVTYLSCLPSTGFSVLCNLGKGMFSTCKCELNERPLLGRGPYTEDSDSPDLCKAKAHCVAASCHHRPSGEAGMSLSKREGRSFALGWVGVRWSYPRLVRRHSIFASGSQQVLGTRNSLECCSFLGLLPQITTVEGLKVTEICSHGSESRSMESGLAGPCPLEDFRGEVFLASSRLRWPLAFPGLWLYHPSPCLPLHMTFFPEYLYVLFLAGHCHQIYGPP